MRVISGTAKGRRLVAPRGERVRPALDRVKEAIFDILFDVAGARVVDLFAGTGSMGIEALSRGAASAVFVEEWQPAARAIRDNLGRCGFAERARVVRADVARALGALSRRGESFDLAFVDPPYLEGLVNPTLRRLASSGILEDGATVVVEHHPREPVSPPEGLVLTDSRKYGQTCVSFLRKRAGGCPRGSR